MDLALDDLRWMMTRRHVLRGVDVRCGKVERLSAKSILGREDMEICIKGKVREVHDEEASYEDRATGKVRAYRRQWVSVFIPDGQGMGESVALTPKGVSGPIQVKIGDEVSIRLRSFEEDKGSVKISCGPGDITVIPPGKVRG